MRFTASFGRLLKSLYGFRRQNGGDGGQVEQDSAPIATRRAHMPECSLFREHLAELDNSNLRATTLWVDNFRPHQPRWSQRVFSDSGTLEVADLPASTVCSSCCHRSSSKANQYSVGSSNNHQHSAGLEQGSACIGPNEDRSKDRDQARQWSKDQHLLPDMFDFISVNKNISIRGNLYLSTRDLDIGPGQFLKPPIRLGTQARSGM